MMTKFYNIFFLVLFLFVWNVQSHSTEYFAKANASDGGDGTSWDTPLSASGLQQAFDLGVFLNGDIIYLSGGTYKPTPLGFNITSGITLIGGYDPASVGSVAVIPHYPSSTPTIFSGDLNANSTADDGDVQNIVNIQSASPVTIQGVNFSYAYYNGTVDLTAGAVMAKNTTVTFKNCIFDSNKAPLAYGAGGLTVYGGLVHTLDCIFTNNEVLGRGGAIRLNNNDVSAVLVVERCLVAGNKNISNASAGKYGGGIQVSSGTLWVINSTITNNEAYSNGAGISVGSGYQVYIISSTLANNICRRIGLDASKPYSYGSSIRATGTATLKIVNSIMVEKTDDGSMTDPTYYTESLADNASNYIVSGGNNMTGTFYIPSTYDDQFTAIWQSTDDPSSGTINLYSTAFGTNDLADNGGFSQTLQTTSTISGANVSSLNTLVNTTWGCPVQADLSVDQRGYIRTATTAVGALDMGGTTSTIKNTTSQNSIVRVDVNSYKVISEAQADVVVYNLTGSAVLKTNSNKTIDLTPFSNGLYLIVSNGNSYKVIR